ncbi:hypothetical protein NEOC84_001057|uniref:hypothetical protein n=1 Tax=Neochlamydia sp. AcF84 TaxID=2315858 RepID=UPI0014072AF2|nr:hypothetical protein [Neochlamydia sp. AcF84]NGY95146.1 hypothetical protein [Neochlamydia sp. AcF84]
MSTYLVTPFISGEYPNKVIKWTTEHLEKARESKNSKQTLIAAGVLAADTAVHAIAVPLFAIANVFRVPVKVMFSKKPWAIQLLNKTKLASPKNVAKLALRVLATAFATLATLVMSFIKPIEATRIHETLKILPKKKAAPSKNTEETAGSQEEGHVEGSEEEKQPISMKEEIAARAYDKHEHNVNAIEDRETPANLKPEEGVIAAKFIDTQELSTKVQQVTHKTAVENSEKAKEEAELATQPKVGFNEELIAKAKAKHAAAVEAVAELEEKNGKEEAVAEENAVVTAEAGIPEAPQAPTADKIES